MCCFSGTVVHVSGTKIFARAMDDVHQALVYSMTLSANEALAMILPIPVPPNGPDDAVRFVDLSDYPKIFEDLQRAFPAPAAAGPSFGPPTRSMQPQAKPLVVHSVGKFEASFVPRLADFSRLDPRFRLADAVFDALPQYRDYGFAVFQLKDFGKSVLERVKGVFGAAPREESEIHPMAFVFPRRDPSQLFFPTVHVHDGEVHAKAHFDHQLYLQHDDAVKLKDWWTGDAAGKFVDVARARDLVRADQRVRMRTLHGNLPNQDTVVAV